MSEWSDTQPLENAESADQMSLWQWPEVQRCWEGVKRLPAYGKLVARLIRDDRVPMKAKAILGAGGGYAISPVDLVPGLIPIAGQLDDLYVALTAIQQSIKYVPDEVLEEHLAAVRLERTIVDDDLAAIRQLVKMVAMKTVKKGGDVLGRFSRATIKYTNSWLEKRRT